jgi:hypothetical protein
MTTPSKRKAPAGEHSPEAFLAALPPDRRREAARVRDLIRRHLPEGYQEAVSGKALVFQVPLSRYPDTYNKRPLWYVGLASEKSYLSLHLVAVYGDPEARARLEEGFRAAGKKLDMGKACIHFHKADDLALDAIAEVVAKHPVDRWVAIAQAARKRPR